MISKPGYLNPEGLRCSWCDARCRSNAELVEHHDKHRREDAEAEAKKSERKEAA